MRCKECGAPFLSHIESSVEYHFSSRALSLPLGAVACLHPRLSKVPTSWLIYVHDEWRANIPVVPKRGFMSKGSRESAFKSIHCKENVMKIIFALTLGTIALLLAVTANDSLSARILLAALGFALYAVALSSGGGRGELKTSSWASKPSKPTVGQITRTQRKQLKLQEELS